MNLTAIETEQLRIAHIVNNMRQKQEHIEPTQKISHLPLKRLFFFQKTVVPITIL